jgi:hypothetical protein
MDQPNPTPAHPLDDAAFRNDIIAGLGLKPGENIYRRYAFAVEFFRTKSTVVSALRAGYSESYAKKRSYELPRDPVVQQFIAEFMRREQAAVERAIEKRADEIAEEALTRNWVLTQLKDNVLVAKGLKAPTDEEGNEVGKRRLNLPAANRALELLGTELGMFAKQPEKAPDTGKLPDLELDRKIADLQQQVGVLSGASASKH